MSRNKKVALVTGGSRGIGHELVKQLALNGYQVILTSRDPHTGREPRKNGWNRHWTFHTSIRDGFAQIWADCLPQKRLSKLLSLSFG